MNRTAVGLIVVAIVFLAGFMYLKSQPQPKAPEDATVETSDVIEMQTTPTMAIKQYSSPPEMQIDPKKTYQVAMKTSKGEMNFNLFADEAPRAVNNFVFLAKEGFYNGTIFHRVISGFMIQGGDPMGNGMGGPGYKFEDEPITRDYKRGILAMANSGPDTNGSQFFVMHADTPLQKDYVIFGEVTDEDSLKTVDAIANTPVAGETPRERVTIDSVEVVEK